MRTITTWLSIILIFTIPFKEAIAIPGIGSVSLIVGALVIPLWLFTVLATGKIRKPSPFVISAIVFFLWNFASLIWTLEGDKTMDRAMAFIRMAFLVWFIWDLFTTRAGILRGFQAYILGAWVSIGSIIFNFINGVEAYRNANGRVSASGFDTNEIGLILAMGMPIAWYLIIAKDYKPHSATILRYINYAYIPATLFAIFLTASRGSLIATFPALLFVIGTFNRLGRFQRIIIGIMIVAALFVLQGYIPESSLERISTTGQELSSSDLNGRTDIWRDGFDIFADHIFLGTGAGTFRAVIESGKAPHNTALALLADLGIIGFLLFGLTVAFCAVNVLHAEREEGRMWISFLLIWFLGSMVSNWEHKNLTWLLFSMIGASTNLPATAGAIRDSAQRAVPPILLRQTPRRQTLRRPSLDHQSLHGVSR